MRRWNHGDDGDEVDNMFDPDGERNEDDDGDKVTDEELESWVRQQEHDEAISQMQVEAIHQDMDQRLLDQAVKFCENSWFWKFKSRPTRLREIAKTYRAFERMLQNTKDRRQKES
jgi:hypothetical protein